jgi:hypothetical protein
VASSVLQEEEPSSREVVALNSNRETANQTLQKTPLLDLRIPYQIPPNR